MAVKTLGASNAQCGVRNTCSFTVMEGGRDETACSRYSGRLGLKGMKWRPIKGASLVPLVCLSALRRVASLVSSGGSLRKKKFYKLVF